jgi:hypothetical protein
MAAAVRVAKFVITAKPPAERTSAPMMVAADHPKEGVVMLR